MPLDDALPLVEELRPAPEAAEMFRRLARRPYCLFLDSARRDAQLGRYSFLMADPFEVLEVPADESDALAELATRLMPFRSAHRPARIAIGTAATTTPPNSRATRLSPITGSSERQ